MTKILEGNMPLNYFINKSYENLGRVKNNYKNIFEPVRHLKYPTIFRDKMVLQNKNVFLYWIGKEYKLISILRNLVYLHSTNGTGYNTILITHENIKNYIHNIPEYFYNLCPTHQANYVKVNVICDYGGIWLDSDTLVLDSLDSLFDIIDNNEGFLIKENNILSNSIFGSKKETLFMNEWKK